MHTTVATGKVMQQVTSTGNDGDWAHSDTAHTLTVGTDYVAEITRGNIGAGADTAVVDYANTQVVLRSKFEIMTMHNKWCSSNGPLQ